MQNKLSFFCSLEFVLKLLWDAQWFFKIKCRYWNVKFFFSVLFLQISEGLSFLHSGVKMVHGNLSTENVILNKSGAWKIMGFDFSISSSNPSDAEVRNWIYLHKEDSSSSELFYCVLLAIIQHRFLSKINLSDGFKTFFLRSNWNVKHKM